MSVGKSKPAARTLEALRKDGWVPAVVEKFIAARQIRQDLFGIIDILAIRPRGRYTLGVQACRGADVAEHVKKILAAPRTRLWLDVEGGRLLQVWGWRKLKGEKRWTARRVSIRLVAGELATQELPEV